MYNDVEQTWNKWIEDEDLKKVSHNVKEVQVQLDKLQASMVMMPIQAKIVKIHQQK